MTPDLLAERLWTTWTALPPEVGLPWAVLALVASVTALVWWRGP